VFNINRDFELNRGILYFIILYDKIYNIFHSLKYLHFTFTLRSDQCNNGFNMHQCALVCPTELAINHVQAREEKKLTIDFVRSGRAEIGGGGGSSSCSELVAHASVGVLLGLLLLTL